MRGVREKGEDAQSLRTCGDCLAPPRPVGVATHPSHTNSLASGLHLWPGGLVMPMRSARRHLLTIPRPLPLTGCLYGPMGAARRHLLHHTTLRAVPLAAISKQASWHRRLCDHRVTNIPRKRNQNTPPNGRGIIRGLPGVFGRYSWSPPAPPDDAPAGQIPTPLGWLISLGRGPGALDSSPRV